VANSLLTISMITREALRLFRNSNWYLRTIGRQHDDEFGRSGRKIGSQLRIRLPNDYVVRNGPTAVPQSTNEQNTVLTLATQLGVDVSFSSAERELSLDEYSKRILAPAVNNLAGAVAQQIMLDIEGAASLVRNTDGSGNLISPTAGTWLQAGALLDLAGAPRNDRFIVMDPVTQARTELTKAAWAAQINAAIAAGNLAPCADGGICARVDGKRWVRLDQAQEVRR